MAGIKRELAQNRGMVKKATGYHIDVIRDLVQQEILPFLEEPGQINAIHFRSIIRAEIIYFTLCRFDEYSRLTDANVTDGGDHIKIIFEHRKNDQWGDNSMAVVPAKEGEPDCPVKLIRLYFKRFGLKFGSRGKRLNFRLRMVPGGHMPRWDYSLSASNATQCSRRLLEKHGYMPPSSQRSR